MVVTADISPFSFMAMQLMVPCGGWMASSNGLRQKGLASAAGNSRLSWSMDPCKPFFCAAGGASIPGPQLLWPSGSRIMRFHTSHARREYSVSRFSSGKPSALANLQRARAHQEHVVGIQHHPLRHLRWRLDILHRAHRAHAARGTVDATGVEFHHAIFIGKAAVADAIVANVEFDDVDAWNNGVERIAAGFHYFDRFGARR